MGSVYLKNFLTGTSLTIVQDYSRIFIDLPSAQSMLYFVYRCAYYGFVCFCIFLQEFLNVRSIF